MAVQAINNLLSSQSLLGRVQAPSRGGVGLRDNAQPRPLLLFIDDSSSFAKDSYPDFTQLSATTLEDTPNISLPEQDSGNEQSAYFLGSPNPESGLAYQKDLQLDSVFEPQGIFEPIF